MNENNPSSGSLHSGHTVPPPPLPEASPEPSESSSGMVLWPPPGAPNPDWATRTGWHDDGQGGMVVYAVFRHPATSGSEGWRDPWARCPRLRADHYLMVDWEWNPDAHSPDLLAAIPLGVSSSCWQHYDGCGNTYPWEARREDLTPTGRALVARLEELYQVAATLVTHIDT